MPRSTRTLLASLAVVLVLSGCDRVVRVSGSWSGGDADGVSGTASSGSTRGGMAVDGTGRLVVFESTSTNLLPGGNAAGLFLRDLATGSIERLADGRTPDITADGRYVAYADRAGGLAEVRVLDRVSGTTALVSVLPGGTPSGASNLDPSISDDGRFVAWESSSDQLVPGFVGTNVFVRDLVAGTTDVASRAVDGTQANETSHTPAISADGRYVAFSSWASDLTVGDVATGYREVYRRDLATGTTTKVNLDASGSPISFSALHPSISDDGSVVAFDGPGRVYVRDVAHGTTDDLGRGQLPALSGDGRTVVFASSFALSPWDVNGHLDVYATDRVLGSTAQLSVTSDWRQTPGDPTLNAVYVAPAISDDGFVAAFGTEIALDPADGNGRRDVYVRAARRPTITSVAPAALAPGSEATLEVTGDSFRPGATAGIDVPGSAGVHVTGVQVLAVDRLRVEVTVDPDAPSGPRTLLVANPTAEPGGPASAFGLCPACLAVE
ncbi:MAG: PD40 domain-containing protein [Actinobacteria bacterium]|nr:PD40 domain-containing protein [Actinomycetota bacterium]